MSSRRALQVVAFIAAFGLCFSGVLTYRELFSPVQAASCPAPGAPGTLLGYPACVYGFFMYLALVAVALIGLVSERLHTPGQARLSHVE